MIFMDNEITRDRKGRIHPKIDSVCFHFQFQNSESGRRASSKS